MESNHPSRSSLKRPIPEVSDSDSDSDKPTAEKRVRFPKGKKARRGDEAVYIHRAQDEDEDEEIGVGSQEARAAAKEREMRRSQRNYGKFGEDGIGEDVSKAEVSYEGLDYENFEEDGIQIEPFNLEKEREEGYFDDDGNFVEFAPSEKNQVRDAWLDGLEAGGGSKLYAPKKKDHDQGINGQDLPAANDDIGKIKRRIADVLDDGETVLQALRRLKGSSNRKEKMAAETKLVFDQLTEDAVTLMDKYGEYDVNHEKKEIFEREAQGYESLARARSGVSAELVDNNGGNDADTYDMFADDDEDANAGPSNTNGAGGGGGSNTDGAGGGGSSSQVQNDYVFDESSGYYYSSSLGYYYDPSTGLYCSAASGQWYAFNEETGAYDEIAPHDDQADAATTVN